MYIISIRGYIIFWIFNYINNKLIFRDIIVWFFWFFNFGLVDFIEMYRSKMVGCFLVGGLECFFKYIF